MATTYTDGEELVSASTFDLDASSVTTIKTSATQLKSFFAGGVAGMIANSVLHPFDTVSMRMKVQKSSNLKYAGFSHAVRTILREEGIRGYFGGLGTTLMASPIWAAVYFGSYETLKATLMPIVPEYHSSLVYFFSGALSEVVISGITVPAETVKCRLQLGRNPHNATGGAIKSKTNYRNTFHAAKSIFRAEGVRGFYGAYSACLSVDTIQSGFSFLFYETIKTHYKQYILEAEGHDRSCTTPESLVMGAIAGGAAALFSNPLDVITVRLMSQGPQKRYHGFRHCFLETVKQEGIGGLYKGGLCRILATMPYSGIAFGVYEGIKRLFFEGELEEFDLEDV